MERLNRIFYTEIKDACNKVSVTYDVHVVID